VGSVAADRSREFGQDLIVVPAAGSHQDDRLSGLLAAMGLRVVDESTGRAEAEDDTSDAAPTAWIAYDSSIDEIASLAEDRPAARFLFFFETATDHLAPVLALGESLDHDLETWLKRSERLLSFVRRYRDRTLLIDYRGAQRHLEALASVCMQAGIDVTVPEGTQAPEDDFPFERWLVRQWLNSQGDIDLLEAELEASAHPLGDPPGDADFPVDRLVQAFILGVQRQRSALEDVEREKDAVGSELEAAAEENELLLLQLHQVQEELETVFLVKEDTNKALTEAKSEAESLSVQLANASDKNKALEDERSAIKDQHSELESSNAELAEENELLLLQLHQVQEELETYFLENQELRRQASEPVADTIEARSSAVEETKDPGKVSPATEKPATVLGFWQRYAERRRIKEEIGLLMQSDLFDASWYLEINTDVAEAGMDPAEHYLRYGATEGRNPSPGFNTRDYLEVNDDVQEAGVNPLVHYLRYGKDERRALAPRRLL
jgi:hypothetical protein